MTYFWERQGGPPQSAPTPGLPKPVPPILCVATFLVAGHVFGKQALKGGVFRGRRPESSSGAPGGNLLGWYETPSSTHEGGLGVCGGKPPGCGGWGATSIIFLIYISKKGGLNFPQKVFLFSQNLTKKGHFRVNLARGGSDGPF